jgi:hypothetical protein
MCLYFLKRTCWNQRRDGHSGNRRSFGALPKVLCCWLSVCQVESCDQDRSWCSHSERDLSECVHLGSVSCKNLRKDNVADRKGARYASISQQAGLVPIVEPEVLVLDGDHDLQTSAKITQDVISAVYRELIIQSVLLEGLKELISLLFVFEREHFLLCFLAGTLLKPNMVLAGKGCKTQPSTSEIAAATVRVLQNTVPPAVPGITFLSGGMSEEEVGCDLCVVCVCVCVFVCDAWFELPLL